MGVMEKILEEIKVLNKKIEDLPNNNQSMLNENDKSTYDPKELAEILNVSRKLIYEQTNQGRIPHIKLNSKIIFPKAAIEKWIMETSEDNYIRDKEIETTEIDFNLIG